MKCDDTDWRSAVLEFASLCSDGAACGFICLPRRYCVKDRATIHEFCDKAGVVSWSESEHAGGLVESDRERKTGPEDTTHNGLKMVFVGSRGPGAGPVRKPWAWTMDTVQLLEEWTSICLPAPSPAHLDYYLGVLDTWGRCTRARDAAAALAELGTAAGSVFAVRKAIQGVKTRAMAWLQASPEFQAFQALSASTKRCADVPPKFASNEVIYSPKYAGQTFVSIDVRTANFRMVKQACPGLVPADADWADFLTLAVRNGPVHPDDSLYLEEAARFLGAHSRPFRVKFFGWLGVTHGTQSRALETIYDVHTRVIQPGFRKELTKVLASADEVLYRVSSIDFPIDDLRAVVEAHAPGVFHTRMFTLKRLHDTGMYVKVHTGLAENDTTTNPMDLKCVKKTLIIQAVKYLMNDPIVEADTLKLCADTNTIQSPSEHLSPFQVFEAKKAATAVAS